MTQQPLPFAQPRVGDSGAALLIEHHRAHRVRILGRAPGRALRLEVAILGTSERRTLSPADLVPDAPLTPREEREYDRLDALLAGQDRPPKAEYDRFEALRLRSLMCAVAGGVPGPGAI